MLVDHGISRSRISVSRSNVIGDASRASSHNVAKLIRYSQSSRCNGWPVGVYICCHILLRRSAISEGGQVRVIFADVGLPVVVVWCVVKDILPDLIHFGRVVGITRSVGPWLVDHLNLTYLANQVAGIQLHHALRNLYPEGLQSNLQFP